MPPVAIDEAVAARPHGPLRTIVDVHQGYRQRYVAPSRHLGLPSPYLTVIFTMDEPLTIARHVDPAQAPGDYLAMVGGLHTSPAVVEHTDAQSGIQLRVSPLGARALFGLPAGELANLDLHAAEVIGPLGSDVQERLRSAPTWADRFRLLDRELGAHLRPNNRPPDEVCRAWQLLMASRGTRTVAGLARDVGWSEKHLGNQFRIEIGLTPKVAARVIRFDRAKRLLRTANGADVAARCGYSDQSHLVRDFVAFTGLSPRAWLAAEFGNRQVAGYDMAESGRHDD